MRHGDVEGPMNDLGDRSPGTRVAGYVVRWNAAKGFGFATVEGLAPQVFLHRDQLVNAEWLAVGDLVEFTLRQRLNGQLFGVDVELRHAVV
jgi:cold shock CspA family protein